MKNQETFKMTYSAQQQEEVEAIRNKYVPKEGDKMEQLRTLDGSATKKATTTSITVGLFGTLLLGMGMSLIMSDLGTLIGRAALPLGIATGVLGMGILACAYPLYLRRLKKEREKIAPEILRLTDELMK